jgi:hypothetical protein
MAKSILLVSGLLLAAALAGCSGDDGKSDTSFSTSTQTNVGNATFSGSVSVGPGGGNASASVNGTQGNASTQASWTYDNRTGSISGTGVPVAGQPIEKEESFTVGDNVSTVYVNVTSEGGELTLSLREPGCEDSECAEEAQTASGVASMQVATPSAGQWILVLTLEGSGPVSADYELQIAQLAPGSSA